MAKGNKPVNKDQDKNIIIIRDVYKITRALLEPAIDPHTGRFSDCVRPVDDKGNMILSEEDKSSSKFFIKTTDYIEIYDGKQFDLHNERDLAWWDAVKYSPLIAQSGRWERDAYGKLVIDGDSKLYGKASFYVEVPGEESKKTVSKKFLITDALVKIKGDTYEGLVMKTRLLDNWMRDATLSDVQDYLISYAEKFPERVIDLYDEVNTSYEIILLDAIDKKVITQNRGIFYYGNTQLGTNKDTVLAYLKGDNAKPILESIKKELYN